MEEADPGLKKLISVLEDSIGKTQLDKRGELRKLFHQDIRRAPGKRIATFCTGYRTLVAELGREGINLPTGELGWFLKDRLGLNPIWLQLWKQPSEPETAMMMLKPSHSGYFP